MEKSITFEFQKYYEDIFLEEEFNLGKLYKAINKDTREEVYIKIYIKNLLKKYKYDYLIMQIEREVKLCDLCESDHILKVNKKIETEKAILLEYEYYDMNLMEYLNKSGEMMKSKEYKEFFKKTVRELAEALNVLYNKKVIHRDIKPNNIFLINKNKDEDFSEDYMIKLGNFNASILLKENDNKQIGTISFTPPEIFKKMEYDEKVDLWSLGMTLYQLYMGHSPYGHNINLNLIKYCLYGNNFIYLFSDNNCLNILFKKLMTLNPKDRMNHKEFFEYVSDKNFMAENENFKNDKYKDIEKEIEQIKSSDNYKKLIQIMNIPEDKEVHEEIAILKKNWEKTIVSVDNLLNLMSYYKGDLGKGNLNNIIYYDENVDNYQDSINEDADFFENNTLGTFLLCTDIVSLNLTMLDIVKENKDDNQLKFNLIVTGSKSEKVMKYLKQNKYENFFENICIYCMDVDKYLPLKKEYKKIYGVYRNPVEVVEFIKKFSSEKIKPFRTTKLVTLEEYKSYYYYWHKIVSLFYGDLTKERFNEYIGKMKNLIDEEGKNKTLFNIDKETLLGGFKKFDIKEDLDELDKKIINEYTSNSYYGDINKWLMNFSISSFQETAYFTARLMYSLNNYSEKEKKFFCKNQELYRGTLIPFSSILAYQRAKGKIIILSAFTSSSEDKSLALRWAGRDKQKNENEYSGVFSVVFYIKNIWNENWISNGINVQEVGFYKDKEKEILFQPFTFCYVTDVELDLKKYTADIHLETIGKTKILENDIKTGKRIEYNEELKTIQVLE